MMELRWLALFAGLLLATSACSQGPPARPDSDSEPPASGDVGQVDPGDVGGPAGGDRVTGDPSSPTRDRIQVSSRPLRPWESPVQVQGGEQPSVPPHRDGDPAVEARDAPAAATEGALAQRDAPVAPTDAAVRESAIRAEPSDRTAAPSVAPPTGGARSTGPDRPAPARDTAAPPREPPPEAGRPISAWDPRGRSGVDERPSATPDPVAAPPVVSAGTTIDLVVDRKLSTESDVAGTEFTATVVEDVLAPDRAVLIAKGVTARGRVLEAHPSEGSEDEARLAVVVEALVIDGQERWIESSVLELTLETGTQDSGVESAAKVGAGAAAGALIGRLLGRDNKDAAKGAAAGAAAGAAVALATRGAHATVPEGGRLLIRLEAALVLLP